MFIFKITYIILLYTINLSVTRSINIEIEQCIFNIDFEIHLTQNPSPRRKYYSINFKDKSTSIVL